MTARENAETADLTLEVRSLREQLAESEKKCQALTVESEGWARQLAEATGLLRTVVPDESRTDDRWNGRRDAFLSRAPAQAAEPAEKQISLLAQAASQYQQRTWAAEARAESAESTLAGVREIVGDDGDEQSDDARVIRIRALLAPSQGEGGGGNG